MISRLNGSNLGSCSFFEGLVIEASCKLLGITGLDTSKDEVFSQDIGSGGIETTSMAVALNTSLDAFVQRAATEIKLVFSHRKYNLQGKVMLNASKYVISLKVTVGRWDHIPDSVVTLSYTYGSYCSVSSSYSAGVTGASA